MRFLTKIRERQFAKKWRGTYNLSRAVLAGVLAAGCLMPGFAEAAPEAPVLIPFGSSFTFGPTEGENTATITAVSGNAGSICWKSDNGSVEGYTINVNNVNSTQNMTITPQIDIRGGNVVSGNAKSNTVNISNVTFENSSLIHGGYSSSGTAEGNSVIISGSTIRGMVYGGYGNTAKGNSVIISGSNFYAYVHGGSGHTAEGNSVIISGGNFGADVHGGYSVTGEANNNKVILVGKNATYPLSAKQTLTGGNINITGTVYGGYVHGSNFYNSNGNEIHVYGSNTKVGDIANFNNLNFYINHKMTFGDVMLKITGQGETDISESNVIVNVDGAPKAKGDLNTITLIHKTDANSSIVAPSNDNITVNFGPLLTGTGTVALGNNAKDLVLTLNNIAVNENGKSLVETRAAAAFVVNNMSDFMLGTGMEQAKAAAGGVTPIDAGTMAPFAAVGGSNMRYTTGSYVDVNGWNGAVGFAKQADKLLFGVAVEHGRGNYDSYLDNGVHASGDIKSTGGVIFGEYKLDNGVHYDAALRAGRVKSDYSSTATSYDESSTYYGFSLGGGKELTVSDKATLDVYGRYYFSHTNGSDVSIATGEEIDFDAVNSHRLRIGGRYTTTLTEKSKAYAGLAWQYEFGGDAKAAINGYSAPTPSLQGHSAIVEAGYKLNAGKNPTLDFNLNGAMGKQRGIGGGIGAQWLF